jgi:hypothetical protein
VVRRKGWESGGRAKCEPSSHSQLQGRRQKQGPGFFRSSGELREDHVVTRGLLSTSIRNGELVTTDTKDVYSLVQREADMTKGFGLPELTTLVALTVGVGVLLTLVGVVL